jgi:hypothetical protein
MFARELCTPFKKSHPATPHLYVLLAASLIFSVLSFDFGIPVQICTCIDVCASGEQFEACAVSSAGLRFKLAFGRLLLEG